MTSINKQDHYNIFPSSYMKCLSWSQIHFETDKMMLLSESTQDECFL